MTTGDKTDFITRIRSLLPDKWFQGDTPVLDAILSGISAAFASVYDLTSYARLQTRIATATDVFLDLISLDFFGGALPRQDGEENGSFRLRIQRELLLEKGTRKGIIRALEILTGRTPGIFEPRRMADTGAYGHGTLAYGVAGGYGSRKLPYQAFVTAYRPPGKGIPYVAGYGVPQGAYRTPSRAVYVGRDSLEGAVSDADIYAAIASTQEKGTIAWTKILN